MNTANSWKLVNSMMDISNQLEQAISIKDNSKIKNLKEILTSLQKQMQDEIERF
jgi:molecular chaperone GrpE (heat shock protein)